MKISNAELKTTFELPDSPTRRDVLRYDSATDSRAGASLYERLWAGVAAIAKDWQSEILPVLDAAALDSQDISADVMMVIKWAGLAAFSWKMALEERTTDPNS